MLSRLSFKAILLMLVDEEAFELDGECFLALRLAVWAHGAVAFVYDPCSGILEL